MSQAPNTGSAQANTIASRVHVGTMGWTQDDWAGIFYATGVPARERIRFYARVFDTVEIDSTFYGAPRDAQVRAWASLTPDGFTFCPKAPRALTHDLRLHNIGGLLGEFVRAMRLLGPKLGPILLQMPPDFTHNEQRNVEEVLPTLQQLTGDTGARFAIEFRNRSLLTPETSGLLTRHGVALALADYHYMPRRFEITTDFVYLRLIGRHGDYPRHDRLYGDRTSDIGTWADALRAHSDKYTTAWVMCNNDYEGYSPATANKVKRRLGQATHDKPPEAQGSLF